jgi:hypothetical protein
MFMYSETIVTLSSGDHPDLRARRTASVEEMGRTGMMQIGV